METKTITLGTTTLSVVPVTLGVMREIGIGAAVQAQITDIVARERNWYNGTSMALAAATGKTVEEIEAIPNVVRPQLIEALDTVYRISGIITTTKEGDAAASGEKTES